MKHHYLEYLSDVIRRRWDQLALSNYGDGEDYTFGDVANQILRLHALFRAMGIKPGDKIALAARNSANWAIAYLSISTYKAVVVSILQDFTPDQIANLCKHSESSLLMVDNYVWNGVKNEDLSGLTAVINLADWTAIYESPELAKTDWRKQMLSDVPMGLKPEDIHFTGDPDALALINYTSGSTGNPKGVMLTARSLSSNVETGMAVLPAPTQSTLVSILPMAHMFGQIAEFLYPLCSGTHIYFLNKTPTPQILLKALQEVKPYLVVMVPLVIEKIYKKNMAAKISKGFVHWAWRKPIIGSFVRNQVRHMLKKNFGGKMRYFILGGAALNPEVEDCLMDIHFPLSIGYGMTECGPLIGGTNPRYFRARSCGQPVLNTEVKIDTPNEEGIGEILVRGENVMLGYYKAPEETAKVFTEDGWMRTGDLGYMDEKNFIYIKGRNKTMILGANGQNIYPEEIEDKLNNLEGVGESVIVEREGKLVALVFPDEVVSRRQGVEGIRQLMAENLKKLNSIIPTYSKVANIEVKEEPFEKTPKKSIKRFLYK